MSTNIKIMRYLSFIAVLSLVFSYIIHLNMELRFCVLNSPCISNNFIFTICSGAFASVVIALLMEARQYSLNKVNAKNLIFYDATILFSQFSIIKYTLLRVKEHPDNIISPDAFTMPVSICEQIIDSLHNIDYQPIFKSDKLVGNLKEMDNLITNSIAPLLVHIKYFVQQAIIQDRILELQRSGNSINPSYNSYYCKLTIDRLLEDIIPMVNELTISMRRIAKAVNRQDKFEQLYEDFTRYEDNYEAPSLEKYLGL